MIDYQDLINHLTTQEGFKRCAYHDTRGVLTICTGHKVLPGDHIGGTACLSPGRCSQLFHRDIASAIAAVAAQWPRWESYPQDAQEVLVELAYVLGEAHLRKFIHFHEAVSAQEWRRAAFALEQSRLRRQIPYRALGWMKRLRALP
jgi:GH24 family phage-related lysozyme (muramidase)